VLTGELQRLVDAADRQDADGAAGTVDHPHVLRQEIDDAVAEDRMRMAAAELHQVVGARRIGGGSDVGGDVARQRAIAEFVDVADAHGSNPGCAAAGEGLSSRTPASANRASVASASSGDSFDSAKPTWRMT
jgi:hypothetical protein